VSDRQSTNLHKNGHVTGSKVLSAGFQSKSVKRLGGAGS